MIGVVQHAQSLTSAALSMIVTAGSPFAIVGIVAWRTRARRSYR